MAFLMIWFDVVQSFNAALCSVISFPYLLDLRSALPTLDRIVKGFRKLGATNKTRDVLYFQVTSVHNPLPRKRLNMPGVFQEPFSILTHFKTRSFASHLITSIFINNFQ